MVFPLFFFIGWNYSFGLAGLFLLVSRCFLLLWRTFFCFFSLRTIPFPWAVVVGLFLVKIFLKMVHFRMPRSKKRVWNPPARVDGDARPDEVILRTSKTLRSRDQWRFSFLRIRDFFESIRGRGQNAFFEKFGLFFWIIPKVRFCKGFPL